MFNFVTKFINTEAAGGIVLMLCAVIAMALANSPLVSTYFTIITPLMPSINDGLMVVFFMLIGLEIKREIVEGELSTRQKAALPVVAAIGGVLLPAIIYSYFNYGKPEMRGWAIPCATDIAFSLGVVALFGSRLNPSLKIFLMALAVIDDLIAVLIIAFFYTDYISYAALAVALCAALVMWSMNRGGIIKIFPYMIIGSILWVAVLFSGVHATIAGVIIGLIMPLAAGKRCIHNLHPWVAFGVMPIFAFANAGIPLAGIKLPDLLNPLPLGIMAGLFLGKQLGIFAAAWLAVKMKIASLPSGTSVLEFYSICIIAGIGFTMSFFIGGLAFTGPELQIPMRLGVIAGSILSAAVGSFVLWRSLRLSKV